jgi:ferredoxin-NADP reductase
MEILPNGINRFVISKIITETAAAKTFVLTPLDGWQPVYASGQFVTLVFYTPYGEKRRSYSISSSSALNEPLSITVKKVDNGEFSRRLVYSTEEGTVLYTSGISGLFQLPAAPATVEQFFFLAAGSGITPCFSLLKTVLATTNSHVTLIYSNKTQADAIFYAQLKRLEQEYPQQLAICFLFSDVFNVYHSRLSHWLLQQLLQEYIKTDIRNTLFYMCGPFDYMLTISITLLGHGLQPQQIIKENFSTLPRLNKPKPPDTKAHAVSITLEGKTETITVQYPHSILAAAKENNIAIPYSCEAGRCGSCIATCTKGKVWMAYNEVLLDEEVAAGRILTCQAYPVEGDVTIEV